MMMHGVSRIPVQSCTTLGGTTEPTRTSTGATARSIARSNHASVHGATQVAVTTSLLDPLEDFAINARGTLNVLEAIRATEHRPPLLFTSTNKVYGGLQDVPLTRAGGRYVPLDPGIAASGVDERRPLDF